MKKLLTPIFCLLAIGAWCQSTLPEKIKKELDSLKEGEVLEIKKEKVPLILDGDLVLEAKDNAGIYSKIISIKLWGDSVLLTAADTVYRFKVTRQATGFFTKPVSSSRLDIRQQNNYIILTYSYSGKSFNYKYEYVPWIDL